LFHAFAAWNNLMPRLLVLIVLGCLAGCRATSETAAWLTTLDRDAEALAGARAAVTLESTAGGIYRCSDAERRLARVGEVLAVHCSATSNGAWQFHLLGSDNPNAFALPVNRIYLTRGLYQRIGEDDSLLAAAVAHEMAHLQNRDNFKPPSRSPHESLHREQAADRLAAEYLQKAGYDVESLPRLLLLIADVQPDGWAETRVRYLCASP
jgi:predicted Zn-dependent protease